MVEKSLHRNPRIEQDEHHLTRGWTQVHWEGGCSCSTSSNRRVTVKRHEFHAILKWYRTPVCSNKYIWFIVFNATFSNISDISWRPVFCGGRTRSTQREPSTIGKQLVSFITCDCGSSASFFVIYKAGHEPTPYWWYACMSY